MNDGATSGGEESRDKLADENRGSEREGTELNPIQL